MGFVYPLIESLFEAQDLADIPEYEKRTERMAHNRPLIAERFALQIEQTVKPFLNKPFKDCSVLDLGCGYGYTASALAIRCAKVVGVEPSADMLTVASTLNNPEGKLSFVQGTLAEVSLKEQFDVVVLDNVFEHIEDQVGALREIDSRLGPAGVVFFLIPNKLWPIEVHYRLPFLSYLPLLWANRYLRWTGFGTDYRDASFAPTYWSLKRMLRTQQEWEYFFTLPADISLAQGGSSIFYRVGVNMIERFPALWAVSKAFLVVARRKT